MGRVRRMQVWSMVLSALSVASFTAGGAAGHPCAAIAADVQRLACYDAAFGRPAAADPASAVVAGGAAAAAPGSAAMPATSPVAAGTAAPSPAARAHPDVEPEEVFGFNEAQQRERVPETVKQQPEKLSSIESTVTVVSNRRTGEFVYTLANGQVWIQTEADQGGYVRDGSPVTVKQAALGSYKLISGNVSTRVRRVQ